MSESGPRKQPLILVVDANPGLRVMARETLEQLGAAVTEASDESEALRAVAEHRPDLVLLDVSGSGDDFSLCQEIQRAVAGHPTAVVIVTEREDVESIRHAYEAGATDFVTRPINWLLLSHRIRYMLRMHAVLQDFRRSEERLARAQRIARMGSWELDIQTERLDCSPELHRLLGLPGGGRDVAPSDVLERLAPRDRLSLEEKVRQAIREGTRFGLDHRIVSESGEERVVHTQAETIVDETGPRLLIGTTQDVTDRKRAEAQIRFLAYHDGLTHLANRRFFRDRLKQSISHAERYDNVVAVLFLDLDHFKRINDTFGHQVGDVLLQQVAGRLVSCVRESDCVSRTEETSTVSRLGGDEFMVLLSEVRDVQDAARVAQRVLKVLARPFSLSGNEVVIGASVGITVCPGDGGDVDTLMRNADAAMYHAKETGRNTYKFYEHSMNEVARHRLKLEGELRKAVERGELLLHFQPKVDVETLRINGFEALVRWEHPTLGRVAPYEFIPVAEQGGLIGSVGEFVLRTACLQAKAWREAGFCSLRVAVNLSPHQFKEGGIAETVAGILAESSLSPRHLDLEITESALMENETIAVSELERLKRIGITVSLDDFGTGYSSLGYLKRFPVDALKIDRGFIRDCETDADDAAIAATIISMGRMLNLKVVAEGVETEGQLAFLREHCCHEMQGYFFSPPVPADEATALLERHGSRTL